MYKSKQHLHVAIDANYFKPYFGEWQMGGGLQLGTKDNETLVNHWQLLYNKLSLWAEGEEKSTLGLFPVILSSFLD